jgi:Holliday junction DNA helicase RuvA
LSLFGFVSSEEKNMFLKLISVSGVGPKMGIGILSSVNINELAIAIASSDIKALSGIKGCGKKTAERIILELREKVSALDLKNNESVVYAGLKTANEDAVIALMTLGFSRSEGTKAVELAKNNGAGSIEDIISEALKYLSRV